MSSIVQLSLGTTGFFVVPSWMLKGEMQSLTTAEIVLMFVLKLYYCIDIKNFEFRLFIYVLRIKIYLSYSDSYPKHKSCKPRLSCNS